MIFVFDVVAIIISVARALHDVDGHFCSLILRSRHLVFGSGLLGNLSALVFVNVSWVRDWLWLGKVLAPLAHPIQGKLLHGLM